MAVCINSITLEKQGWEKPFREGQVGKLFGNGYFILDEEVEDWQDGDIRYFEIKMARQEDIEHDNG